MSSGQSASMSRIRQSCLHFCERFGNCCSGSNTKSNPSSPQSPPASGHKLSSKQPSRTPTSNGAKRLSAGGAVNGVSVATAVSAELSNGQQVGGKLRAESQQTTHSLPNGNGTETHCACDTCRTAVQQAADRRTDADSSGSSSGSEESHAAAAVAAATAAARTKYSHSQQSATPKHSVAHVTSSSAAQNGTLDSLHSTHSAQCAHADAKSPATSSTMSGRARSQPDTSNLVLPSRRSGTCTCALVPRLEPLRSVTRSSHDDADSSSQSQSDELSAAHDEARDHCSAVAIRHAQPTCVAAAAPGAPSNQTPQSQQQQQRGGRRSDPCSRTSSLIRQPAAHSQALLSSEMLSNALRSRTEAAASASPAVSARHAHVHAHGGGARQGSQEASVGGLAMGMGMGVAGSVSGSGSVSGVFVALFDFRARDSGDLDFRKGDLFRVLDRKEDDWWYAQKVVGGELGYLPAAFLAPDGSLDAEDWYHGCISRKDAERLLLLPGNSIGTFLVRDSESTPGQFSLSVRDRDPEKGENIKHYRLARTDDAQYFFDLTKKPKYFASLEALIKHFSGRREGLCCPLGRPCPKPLPTTDLCRRTRDQWEIPRSELEIVREIGRGQFGFVYLAKWRSSRHRALTANSTASQQPLNQTAASSDGEEKESSAVYVAVKELRPEGGMSANAFLEEATIMKRLQHENLVRLLAVCSEGSLEAAAAAQATAAEMLDGGGARQPLSQPQPIYIVTEFLRHGSLLDYLKKGPGQHIRLPALIDIMAQVAAGMAYLEKEKYVHRDLAARNILVGDNNTAKIADFGLARFLSNNEYSAHNGAKFPIKWTAPEAALSGRFTTKSDVWSFGIVLFEIITRGSPPYNELSNRETLEHVTKGFRLPRPMQPQFLLNCPEKLYEKMMECWNAVAEKRPTFDYLSDFFNEYYESTEPNYRSEKLELQLKKEGLLDRSNCARNRTPPTGAATATATAASAMPGAMHIRDSSFVPIQTSNSPVSVSVAMSMPVQTMLPHPASFVQVIPTSQLSHVHSISSPAQQPPRAFVPVLPHANAITQLVHTSNGSLAGHQVAQATVASSAMLPIGAGFRGFPLSVATTNGQPPQIVYAAAPAAMQFVAAGPGLQLMQQPLSQPQHPSASGTGTGSTSSLPNAVHLQMQQAAHATSPLAIQSASQLPPDAASRFEHSAAAAESTGSHNEIDSSGRRGRDALAGAVSMEDSFIAV